MKVEQLYTSCLAQGAYYIESAGEAAIIDPLREASPYLEMAKERGATIKYIFETHFHADFVSGHLDLSAKTGASIVFGPNAKTSYDIYSAKDGEIFQLGNLSIKVLHTPGHTLESTTYLLIDEQGADYAIFTGDTLFIGDVGRPDLAAKSDLTKEDLAAMLYDSLRDKILPLGDEVIVYPGHGAGSACGKNLSKETFATLGHQKENNYALQDMTKAEFVEKVITGLSEPPQYFPENVMLNKTGYSNIDSVMASGLKALSVEDFAAKMAEGVFVLDTRNPYSFNQEYVPGAINIGLNGTFAPWVGALITSVKRPILLIAEEGTEEESVLRLARVGYDHVVGYLKGGVEAWKNAGHLTESIQSINAAELENIKTTHPSSALLDVRNVGEYNSEHLETAMNYPLGTLADDLDNLDAEDTYYVYCAGGYRSMIASSILKAHGFVNVVNVEGGFRAIKETSLERTAFVCPSTLG